MNSNPLFCVVIDPLILQNFENKNKANEQSLMVSSKKFCLDLSYGECIFK